MFNNIIKLSLILFLLLLSCNEQETISNCGAWGQLTVNSPPIIRSVPDLECVPTSMPFRTEFYIVDPNLFNNSNEIVYIEILSPEGFKVEPSEIKGQNIGDFEEIPITLLFDGITKPYVSSETLVIAVTDKAGAGDTLETTIRYSDEVLWECPIKIENSRGDYEILSFGTARNATTGDGSDQKLIGGLDAQYCEYELPFPPDSTVFDARWMIPLVWNGILRNIYPGAAQGVESHSVYRCAFQPGEVTDKKITISWDPNLVPATEDNEKNPMGGSWFIKDAISNGSLFNYNMNTGVGNSMLDIEYTQSENECKIIILRDIVHGFIIEHFARLH